MTLLSALNDAQRLLSLAVTSGIVADGQETQNLLLALANREAKDLAQRHEWPQLTRTKSFTTSLASLQSSGKASDFDRAIAETFWNQTQNRKVFGPLNAEEWGIANGASVSSATWASVMFRYDGLHIFPTPTAAETVSYDYIVNTPVLANDGVTYKTAFTADNDTFVLDEELLILGVLWRYKQAKGRDYAEDMKSYEIRVQQAIGNARGAPRTLMIAPEDAAWPPDALVPDTGYGA